MASFELEASKLKGMVKALEAFADEHDGELAIGFGLGPISKRAGWSVSLTWGKEAPDSPMAAAQALGVGHTLEDALRKVAEEAKIELPEAGPKPSYLAKKIHYLPDGTSEVILKEVTTGDFDSLSTGSILALVPGAAV
jgi:hypothetical protein